jgi:hypothetical protein
MTWPVIWQDEHGGELGRINEPGFPPELIDSAIASASTACLRFVDPYGDTVFNQAQLNELLRELEKQRAGITDLRVRRNLEELLAFLRPCVGQMHTYIKIIGD